MNTWSASPKDFPFVRDLCRGAVSVECSGDRESVGASGRVAIIAHYSQSTALSRSVRRLIAELSAARYEVVLVSAGPAATERETSELSLAAVVRKPNVGYDFGSWSVALAAFPAARAADRVILTNDSMVGPFSSIQHFLQRYEESTADVWGMTETRQFWTHLQSFFVGYKGGILNDRVLGAFWAGIRHFENKLDIVRWNELELGLLLRGEGYSIDAAFLYKDIVEPGLNPTIRGWQRLLDAGFPFVKRELLTNPDVRPPNDMVRRVVHHRFGCEIAEWL